jgi:Domain of unknown function (DUF4430)
MQPLTEPVVVVLEALDSSGRTIFKFVVPAGLRLNVRSILEHAFVENQTSAAPEPFRYRLEYFGFSKTAAFHGHLGYELESIGELKSGPSAYWSFSINGRASDQGIDATYPVSGDRVTFQYVTSNGTGRNARETVIMSRRAARK